MELGVIATVANRVLFLIQVSLIPVGRLDALSVLCRAVSTTVVRKCGGGLTRPKRSAVAEGKREPGIHPDGFSITTNEKGRRRSALCEGCFASAFSEACFPASPGLHSFLSAVIAGYSFPDVKCVFGSRTMSDGIPICCQPSSG